MIPQGRCFREIGNAENAEKALISFHLILTLQDWTSLLAEIATVPAERAIFLRAKWLKAIGLAVSAALI